MCRVEFDLDIDFCIGLQKPMKKLRKKRYTFSCSRDRRANFFVRGGRRAVLYGSIRFLFVGRESGTQTEKKTKGKLFCNGIETLSFKPICLSLEDFGFALEIDKIPST